MKTIVFDFDGTICDSFQKIVESFNEYAAEYHYNSVDSDQIAALRDLDPKELVRYLGIDPSRFSEVLKKVVSRLYSQIDELQPFVGMKQSLLGLKAQGYRLGVLTSNTEEAVKRFSKNTDIPFDFIYGGVQFFGKHELMKKMLEDLSLSEGDVIYVGDETRDIEAAHKTGIQMIAVGWGFNSSKILNSFKPEALIQSPEELIPICLQLFEKKSR